MRRVELAWPYQATGQLRLPALCVYSGGPAEEGVFCQFLRPGPVRFVRYSRVASLYLPATQKVARRVRTLRAKLIIGVPALMICGFALAIVSGTRAEASVSPVWAVLGYVAIAMMCAGLALPFVVFLTGTGWIRGRVGFDEWVRVKRVNRRFADACVALNPPGMVRVGIAPPPRRPPQNRAPVAAYGQSQVVE